MSLRSRILLHLLLVHLILAAIAVVVLLHEPVWLLVLELLFILSLVAVWLLVRALFVPLELIRTGAELIEEREFTSRFREVGQPEMDELIRVYNRMIDCLREERLKLQEQRVLLDSILAVSPSGLLTLDFDGKVSALNPAAERLLGITAEAARGRDPGDLGTSLGAELAAVPGGTSRLLQLGGRRRVRGTRATFFDQGFPRSFFLLEEMTEELRASERSAYRKLIRMMSHEINNSLGSVTSLLDSFRTYAAQLQPEDRADFEGALHAAGARLEHLNAFMKGFADVVRLPAPEPRPTAVKKLLDDIVVLLGPELARRRIACGWDEAQPLDLVPMDKNQMEQVLVNVLRNAMEAIGEDGSIRLSLSRANGRPRLGIRDTGGGVPEAALPQLFTPFFSTKRDGRGLGLTLVQEILGSHGFDFGLDSRAGEGSEFWIAF